MSGPAHLGDYRVACDYSGFKCWASETAKTWDGYRVLRRFLGSEYARHPQDLVKGVRDDQSVPDPRPEGSDTFLEPGDVTPSSL